jgi:hypothetical protein
MPRSLVVAAAVLVAACALPAAAAAQSEGLDPQCAALTGVTERPLQDACQKSADIFNLVAPQLGPGIAGGNALLGSGAALGGLGRVSVGARANFVRGRLPRLGAVPVSTQGAQRSDFATTEPTVYLATADVALGLFGGFDAGPVHIGGLDALGSLTYVPDYDNADVSVRARGRRFQLGYGARLGLLQESALVPGIGVTYLRRDLPESEVLGRVAASGAERNDTLGVAGLRTRTQAWRAVASKTLGVVTLSAGGGQDAYRSRGRVRGVLNETFPIVGPIRVAAERFDLRQRVTRTNLFADLSLTLPVVVLTGEVGRASGGRVVRSFNTFDGRDDRAQDAVTYYAAGLRLRF